MKERGNRKMNSQAVSIYRFPCLDNNEPSKRKRWGRRTRGSSQIKGINTAQRASLKSKPIRKRPAGLLDKKAHKHTKVASTT